MLVRDVHWGKHAGQMVRAPQVAALAGYSNLGEAQLAVVAWMYTTTHLMDLSTWSRRGGEHDLVYFRERPFSTTPTHRYIEPGTGTANAHARYVPRRGHER